MNCYLLPRCVCASLRFINIVSYLECHLEIDMDTCHTIINVINDINHAYSYNEYTKLNVLHLVMAF